MVVFVSLLQKSGNHHNYLFYCCFKTLKAFQEEGTMEMFITTIHDDMKLKLVSVTCSRGIIANHLIIYLLRYFSISF